MSERQDLNLRPLAPHASALSQLRHAPRYASHWIYLTLLRKVFISITYDILIILILIRDQLYYSSALDAKENNSC